MTFSVALLLIMVSIVSTIAPQAGAGTHERSRMAGLAGVDTGRVPTTATPQQRAAARPSDVRTS
jgi:hypothetical protein